MKLEITLTDKQAAPFVAALEKLANPLVAAMPEPTPAPTLPEPPEGFHPAMMGPIKGCGNSGDYIPGIAIFDAYGSGEWCTKDDWSGNQPKRIYALRIGSNIARLNGLELTLELGRTYATNAGEIVTFTDACDGTMWNPIGQALIDGVAQPLSHPDSIREEIPAELLPLPKLPDGFKEWRWRGKGFSKSSIRFAFGDVKDGWEVSPCDWASGNALYNQRYYYLEAIPCTPDDVFGPEAIPADKELEPAKRREWDASIRKATGKICYRSSHDSPEIWEFTRVREVLPGDPTMEQVEELVKEAQEVVHMLSNLIGDVKASRGIREMAHEGLTMNRDGLLAKLQPFTGKESE